MIFEISTLEFIKNGFLAHTKGLRSNFFKRSEFGFGSAFVKYALKEAALSSEKFERQKNKMRSCFNIRAKSSERIYGI